MPTPGSPTGQHVLLNLATAAARQPVPPSDHPRYAYIKTRGWYLNSRIDGHLETSTVIPTTTTSWLAPDGSGRVITAADKPGSTPSVITDIHPRAGHHPLLQLTTNKATLAHEMARGHPRSDGPVEQFVALTDLASREPIPGDVQALILRQVAKIPGLANSGTVTDRAGRSGVAVSLESSYTGLPTRYTWIFDPKHGRAARRRGKPDRQHRPS